MVSTRDFLGTQLPKTGLRLIPELENREIVFKFEGADIPLALNNIDVVSFALSSSLLEASHKLRSDIQLFACAKMPCTLHLTCWKRNERLWNTKTFGIAFRLALVIMKGITRV